jgi:hypothetical protein
MVPRVRSMRIGSVTMRLTLVIGLVALLALVYLVTYVPDRGNGSDFQTLYAAFYADAHGINPFDWPALWRVEQMLYNGGVGHHGTFQFAPFNDLPPDALALRPLTFLAEPDAYRVWAVLLIAMAWCGVYLGLQGWSTRPRLVAASLCAVSPAALFNVRLGQDSTPLLLLLGASLWLRASGRSLLAGATLGLGLYKPHLGLPLAVIFFLTTPRSQWSRMAQGFALVALAGLAATTFFDGGLAAYSHWLDSAQAFSQAIGGQPDLASIPGLYEATVATTTRSVLNGLCLLIVALVVLRLALSTATADCDTAQRVLGIGIAVYLACAPYAHTTDQVLLLLPLCWLVRPDGVGLRDTAVLLAAVACALAPMVVLRNYHTTGINALPPVGVLLGYALQRGKRSAADTPMHEAMTRSAVAEAHG